MGRVGNWFRSLFGWMMGSAEEVIPESAKLDTEAQRMMNAMEKQKDAVTKQMALVTESRDKLEEELANNEALKEQAVRFKKDGNEDLFYRVMEMKVKSDERLEELKKTYEAMRNSGNEAIMAFKAQEKEVTDKVERLEVLKEQARINRIREEVQASQKQFDLTAPSRSFDRMAEKIRLKSAQLNASNLISGNKEKIDQMQIKAAMKDQKVLKAVEALELEMAREGTPDGQIIEGEYRELQADTAQKARALLDEPTFGGIGSSSYAKPKEEKKKK